MVHEEIDEKLDLTTNHVLVHLPTNSIMIHCYNIEFFLRNKPMNKRDVVAGHFHNAVRNYPDHFPNPESYVFNDVNLLWSREKLPRPEVKVDVARGIKMRYVYTGPMNFGANVSENQGGQLLVTLLDAIATCRARNTINARKYVAFKNLIFLVRNVQEEPQLPNMLITRCFQWGLDTRVGISIAIKMNLRAGITACFDLNQSLLTRPAYPLIRLLVDIIERQAVSDRIFENTYDPILREAVITAGNRETMKKILKDMILRYTVHAARTINETGAVVDETRPPDFGIEFTFYDISGPASQETFVNQNGERLTVAQHYLNTYNIVLRYPNLPCIQKKPSRKNPQMRILFPMELVSYAIYSARYKGHVNNELINNVSTYAYTAEQRKMILEHIIAQREIIGMEPVVNNRDPFMTRHGVEFEKKMLDVKASVLPAPRIIYGEGNAVQDTEHRGQWEAVTHEPIRKVLEGSVFERTPEKRRKVLLGSLLIIDPPLKLSANQTPYDPANYHLLMLALELAGQPVVWLERNSVHAAIQAERRFKQGKDDPREIQGFFASLPNTIDERFKNDGDVIIPIVFMLFWDRATAYSTRAEGIHNDYNLFKLLGDNVVGIYTQGMIVDNFHKISRNISTCPITCHMVEKILGKVGTTHRKIDHNTSNAWKKFTDPESPTLVLGIDVCHPNKFQKDEGGVAELSVAAVVGNIDTNITEFRSSTRIQEPRMENIVRMDFELNRRLTEFCEHNKKRPAHIVVYRDGIPEGNFQRILYEEKSAIENICSTHYPKDELPTITYIVASKRHHTKFFLKDKGNGYEEHGFNLKPGTFVDDVVTSTKYYDFFLSSQVGGVTGIVRPTHYYVLHDTWAPESGFWPSITHALTYNFCRATTTVAVPAPVLYAHLAAKRGKETLDGQLIVDRIQGVNTHVDNFQAVDRLIRSINVNSKLDGMTFV